jgi:hypothetical protein
MARSVSRSRTRPPAEKKMRMESTARSRSRSMSKPPRNEMGVKDATVSRRINEFKPSVVFNGQGIKTFKLYRIADEEEIVEDRGKGSKARNREVLEKRRGRQAHLQPHAEASLHRKAWDRQDGSTLNHVSTNITLHLFTVLLDHSVDSSLICVSNKSVLYPNGRISCFVI